MELLLLLINTMVLFALLIVEVVWCEEEAITKKAIIAFSLLISMFLIMDSIQLESDTIYSNVLLTHYRKCRIKRYRRIGLINIKDALDLNNIEYKIIDGNIVASINGNKYIIADSFLSYTVIRLPSRQDSHLEAEAIKNGVPNEHTGYK